MKIKLDVQLNGHFTIVLKDKDGNTKLKKIVNNVVVTAGKEYLVNWLTEETHSDYFMKYIALGSGSTAATASDIDLESQLSTRVAGTISSNVATWQNEATIPAGIATGTISEAGIFSDATGGTMLARQTFGSIVKEATDTLVVTWQIQFSDFNTAGQNYLVSWLAASSQSSYFMPYMALGSGTTPPTNSDTSLESELPTRIEGQLIPDSTVWRNVAIFIPGVNTGDIVEVGLFDSPTAGNMFVRAFLDNDFPPYSKTGDDLAIITCEVTFL